MTESSNESARVMTPEAPEQYAIGISFGNSNSSIAHLSADGKTEVIANEEGDRQIPTILSYIDGEEFHGNQAKAQLVRNGKNTVAYFRDYLGKEFKSIDPTPCHASARPLEFESTVAFSVKDSEADEPHTVTVSEITTRHIRRLKNSASDFLGKTVTAAVVAVPTDTTDAQKAALSIAAQNARVEILQFISEPIAAAYAYHQKLESVSDKLSVVADFGGTRSDVAVVASRGGMYSILSTTHDYELGGSQLDQVLVDHIAKEFMKKYGTDPRKDARSLAKLKLEAESVKKSLSQSSSATFSVESLADGIDFRTTVNRTRYDTLANKVFTQFTRLIEEAVRKADLDVLDIDEVILSGGTASTPRIASNVQSIFPESTEVHAPSTSAQAINPSELAARGAALQASLIQEFEKDDIEQSTHEMVTVTPHLHHAIGLQVISSSVKDGAFALIVAPESAVPVRRFMTFKAPAGEVVVRVCEGERFIKVTKPEPKVNTNGTGNRSDDDDSEEEESDEEEDIREKEWKVRKPLAEFAFKELKKNAKIEVMVNVDADLALSVTAREVGVKGGVRGSLDPPKIEQNGKA